MSGTLFERVLCCHKSSNNTDTIKNQGGSAYSLGETLLKSIIDHFTVVGLVTWPLNGSEAGVELVLIQTALFLLCKSSYSYAN